MIERTVVYVDTSYLLASFYNSWETGARGQLQIDLPHVVHVLDGIVRAHVDQPIQRQYWYDGIPDKGPHRYQRALRAVDGVQLREGMLIEWGERRTQKAVDTRIVADMVLGAVRGSCTDMVLVSGDADMIPGVQEAVAYGIRVHLFGFGWDSMSTALRHACDSTTMLDPREDFGDCMQLEVLEGPIPPVVKGWTPAAPGTGAPEEDETSTVEPEPEPAAAPEPTAGPAAEPEPTAEPVAEPEPSAGPVAEPEPDPDAPARPNPGMMAPRRKLRSRYVPLPDEVWTTLGEQSPFDVGRQFATWWYANSATDRQRDEAHLLSGGGLPPEVDRPLLHFACQTLHEYTLGQDQRVRLRDGFHAGIRAILTS